MRGVPKAELHVHLEGTLEPELMLEMARRNGVRRRFGSVEELRAAYRFTSLQSFLDVYYEGAETLVTERDFHELTRAYLARAHQDNVRHAEVFFDPQTHTHRGVAFETVVRGIQSALEAGAREHGMSVGLIMCFLRHLSEADAIATLEQALPFRPWLLGVGLDSAERGIPPEKFARVFARARDAGLHVVAHAGEEGPAAYVRQALDVLRVERVDHGVRALEDPELVARLARERVPLTVCPLSNVRLGVFPSIEAHNLPHLLDAGLVVTINSDDPAYFGGYVGENYLAVARAFALGRGTLAQLAGNGFDAAFLPEARRAALHRELEVYVAGCG